MWVQRFRKHVYNILYLALEWNSGTVNNEVFQFSIADKKGVPTVFGFQDMGLKLRPGFGRGNIYHYWVIVSTLLG